MMIALATGFRWIAGDGLKAFVLPALLIALATMAHKAWQGYGERIETAATSECNMSWHLAVSKRKERVAAAELQAARDRLQGERDVNMGLANEMETIRTQHAALERKMLERNAADDVADPNRCISAGVWDSIRHDGVGRGGKGTGAAGRGGGQGGADKGR